MTDKEFYDACDVVSADEQKPERTLEEWIETARQYAKNADYWRRRSESMRSPEEVLKELDYITKNMPAEPYRRALKWKGYRDALKWVLREEGI